MNEERKQAYFAELAPIYATATGNATQDIFEKFLQDFGAELGLESSSIVHDNASGPGTATEILLQLPEPPKQIIATDYAKGMIDVLNSRLSILPNSERVTAQVMNSDDLSGLSDGTFTHSISNFSLFTITNAVQSLREMRRTLAPEGTALILLWKRYAVQPLLAAAQDLVKGDGYATKNALPVNGPEYFEKDTVPRQLLEAGFDQARMKTVQVDWLLREDEVAKWSGLHEYMTSTSISAGSTRGWTDDERAKWPGAVEQAMKKEAATNGGLLFQSWITIARK